MSHRSAVRFIEIEQLAHLCLLWTYGKNNRKDRLYTNLESYCHSTQRGFKIYYWPEMAKSVTSNWLHAMLQIHSFKSLTFSVKSFSSCPFLRKKKKKVRLSLERVLKSAHFY